MNSDFKLKSINEQVLQKIKRIQPLKLPKNTIFDPIRDYFYFDTNLDEIRGKPNCIIFFQFGSFRVFCRQILFIM